MVVGEGGIAALQICRHAFPGDGVAVDGHRQFLLVRGNKAVPAHGLEVVATGCQLSKPLTAVRGPW
jgi:hypothetical protein